MREIVIHHVSEESVEEVKPPIIGNVRGLKTQMPFPHTGHVWIPPRHQGRPGGRAHSTVRVKLIQPNALGHQTIQMRRSHVFRAVAREVAVAEVIDQYQDDVRLRINDGRDG